MGECKTCNGAGKHDCEDGGACEHHGAPCPACAPSPSAAGGAAPTPVADEIERSIPNPGPGRVSDDFKRGMEIAVRIARAFERAARPSSEPGERGLRPTCGHPLRLECPWCKAPYAAAPASSPAPTTEKEGRATVSDRLEAAIGAADRLRGRLAAPDRFDCLRCGIGVKADEDGLCAHCGIEVVIVRGGVPDYRAVAVVFEEAATAPAPSSPPGEAPTEEQIAELAALMAQAWPAPWTARTFEIDCPCPNGEHCGDSHTCEEVEAPEAYPASHEAPAAAGEGQCVVQISVPGLESLAGPTARFIALARNLLPSLLEERRRASRAGGVREGEALREAEELLAFYEGSATPIREVTIHGSDFATILAGVRRARETTDGSTNGGAP